MIKRDQVEAILRVNGVTPTAPDEQIRSVLLSARYNNDEVDTALMVLRENIKTKQTHVDGLHKVFRTGEALSPDEISSLLGIEVDIDTSVDPEVEIREFSKLQHTFIWILSFIFAVAAILLYMYIQKIGLFHPSGTMNF